MVRRRGRGDLLHLMKRVIHRVRAEDKVRR
jgi:hypothetical protein